MPANTATFSIEDYDREKSRTALNIGPITLANFTAKRAAIDAYETALAGLILGAIRNTNINEVFGGSIAAVTNQNAQRESKWLVTARDITEFFDVANTIANPGFGNLFQVELATANLTLLANNTDELDLTLPAVVTYITAFEDAAQSPTGGNEVQVVSIRHVGRSI